jgi:hypothetical protein
VYTRAVMTASAWPASRATVAMSCPIDDWENVESLRNHGSVPPYGLALVDEEVVIDALRSLLSDGLVWVTEFDEDGFELRPVASPQTDDASLRRYWFQPTDAGEAVWRHARDEIHAYLDASAQGNQT